MPPVHHHSPVRPLLEGDLIDDCAVAGFGWKSATDESRSTHLDDRLLLVGDERLTGPPDRPMPQAFTATAPMPPADLPAGWIRAADDIDTGLRMRADALLNLSGALWQPVIRPQIGAIHAAGHRVWLSGGATRDLLADVPLHDIKDLDLAGTAPTGRFSDILYQSLRAHGMTAFPTTVNPRSLVCAVQLYYTDTRMLEYRGLKRGGFQFGVVGSGLAEDANHRDFVFNAILYDPVDHEVVDASGCGVDDLLGHKRCFRPLSRPSDPDAAAEIIVRALTFAMRWHGRALDLDPFHEWVATLPDDLVDRVKLAKAIRYHLKDKQTRTRLAEQYSFAESLPKPGRALLAAVLAAAASGGAR